MIFYLEGCKYYSLLYIDRPAKILYTDGSPSSRSLSMYPYRPAATLVLMLLSSATSRLAVAAPAAPAPDRSTQVECVQLYRQAQLEAQRRLASIGGDYVRGWSLPGMRYATESATVLSPFKDAKERTIRQGCADGPRTGTMKLLRSALDTAVKYDRPFAVASPGTQGY